MAISSEDLTRLGKSSLDLYLRNEPVDQIAQERPLLEMLLKGKKPFGGAKQNVVEQIRKDYGSNFAWAYGEAKVNFQKRDTLEQAQFPWRRCVDSVYISYDELFSNGINVREGEKGALQGYLWVTGTPFSLEYPSLRGGFGWHDISWKHHFQV